MRSFSSIFSFVFLTIIIFSGCSQKMHFATSPAVPAATGEVKIKKDDNNNYIITVNVVNLAESKNLTPSRNTYVVWMESDGQNVKNIGQINSSTGLLSKALKGELKAAATSKPTKIFITAEDDGNVQYPGNQLILTTN